MNISTVNTNGMPRKTIEKDENLGLELIQTLFDFELWSNCDDFHGYAEQCLESFDDYDDASEAYAAMRWQRASEREAAYHTPV